MPGSLHALSSEVILPSKNGNFTVLPVEGGGMLDGNLCALSQHERKGKYGFSSE